MATEERHQPAVLRSYEGDGIVVHWEPALCIHTANCIRSLPQTFDPGARPWIRAEGVAADDIVEAIERCPTGALWYERTDGAEQELAADPPEVQARLNGPLYIRGAFNVLDAEGNVIRTGTRMALCRCGNTKNAPFCDLSHRAAGWRSR